MQGLLAGCRWQPRAVHDATVLQYARSKKKPGFSDDQIIETKTMVMGVGRWAYAARAAPVDNRVESAVRRSLYYCITVHITYLYCNNSFSLVLVKN